jgi:phage shock protein C
MKKLMRARDNRIIAGVCGGIGEYLDVDPTLIRVLWALFSIFSIGTGILAYLAVWLIVPEEAPEDKAESKTSEIPPGEQTNTQANISVPNQKFEEIR